MSPAQHMEALAKATEVRVARAEVRHALFERRMTVDEALGLECCESMLVFDLLRAQYRWGPRRATRVMRSIPVSPRRLVEDLTGRQRDALAKACSGARKETR